MTIRFFDPLSRAFGRMKQALFQPFSLKKWFVVGFTAFLAGLTDCHGGSGGGSGSRHRGRVDWDELIYFPHRALDWLGDNPHWFVFILFGLFLLFIFVVFLVWLSSRGKFMFLDNVVHDRAQVVNPWYEYGAQGTSLFLFRLVASILIIGFILSYLIFSYSVIVGIYEETWEPATLIGPVVLLALGFAAIILIVSFMDLVLMSFVVPIMYRSKIGVLAGWGVFLRLFGSRPFPFIGYGLFYVFLSIVIVVGIIVTVIVTCCIALLFLILPYISSVVLLPVSYTLRAFSVEFLEQFGPEYRVFPVAAQPEKPRRTGRSRKAGPAS